MMDPLADCILCRGAEGDTTLERIPVWQDAHWRLTMSTSAQVPGFSYLEPKRHIPHITDLDGEEARTLGTVLAWVARVLREETRAELVYIYVFGGGIPHLHIHLAPHRTGDALNSQMIRGEIIEEKLPSGATRIIIRDFPPLLEEKHRAIARRVQQRLFSVGTKSEGNLCKRQNGSRRTLAMIERIWERDVSKKHFRSRWPWAWPSPSLSEVDFWRCRD